MSDHSSDKGKPNPRDARLRAALRANLSRRKAQARARNAVAQDVDVQDDAETTGGLPGRRVQQDTVLQSVVPDGGAPEGIAADGTAPDSPAPDGTSSDGGVQGDMGKAAADEAGTGKEDI